MKKIIFFLLLLITSLSVFSQDAQNTFFGCKFGSPTYQMNAALRRHGYEEVNVDKNKIRAYDVKFGGYNFRFATFEYINNQFYSVVFSLPFVDRESALSFFFSINESLKEKYGSLSDYSSDSLYDYSYIGANNCAGCNMTKNKTRSKGDSLYYYVELYYYNFDLMKKVSDKERNEL